MNIRDNPFSFSESFLVIYTHTKTHSQIPRQFLHLPHHSQFTVHQLSYHTKIDIPTIFHRLSLPLWPNFLLTQFLTNHGSFRSYLHKMNKTPSPNCNFPETTVQTAHHLMLECSLWSKDRPSVLKSPPPHIWFCSTT